MAAWQFTLTVVCMVVASTLAADCVDQDSGNKLASNGETFNLPMSGPCIDYLCDNGGYQPSSVKCAGKGDQCHSPGETFQKTMSDGKDWSCSCTISAENKVSYECK